MHIITPTVTLAKIMKPIQIYNKEKSQADVCENQQLLLTMITLVKSPEVLFNPLSTVNEKKTEAS